MSPIYLNPQSSSPIPFLDMKGDQQHSFQVFGYLHDDHLGASNNNNNTNTSSFPYHTYDHEVLSLDSSRHKQENKVEKLVLSQEMKASDLGRPCSSWLQTRLRDENGCNTYAYSINLEEEQKNNESVNYDDQKYSRKWKPSKVRIMQKMMGKSKNSRDQITNNNSKQQIVDHDHLAKRQTSDGVRVCTDCHTTTTPLWRSGPQGPKSLCNACGIRQRKARRAAMAAAAAAGFSSDTMVTSTEPPVQSPKPNKVETIMKTQKGIDNLDKTHTLPLKKRTKIINANKNNYTHNYSYNNNNNNSKKICFEDFALSSNKDYINPNPKKSFPRDEEEGAILLMALSCGLACSSY